VAVLHSLSGLTALRDKKAKARIAARLRQAEAGNLGDWKPVGEGVAELRIHVGSGIPGLLWAIRTALSHSFFVVGTRPVSRKT